MAIENNFFFFYIYYKIFKTNKSFGIYKYNITYSIVCSVCKIVL